MVWSGKMGETSRSTSQVWKPKSMWSTHPRGQFTMGLCPSRPVRCPVLRISPLPLPAPYTWKFLTIFFPKRELVATLRDFSLTGVSSRGSQSFLLTKRGLAEKIFFSLFCASGGSGWGLFGFVSWLTFIRVWNVYPHKQWNMRRKERAPFISISSGRAGLSYSLV